MQSLKLPNGDALLAATQEYGQAFTVGGSRPIGGGLIVGRRIGPGSACPHASLSPTWSPGERVFAEGQEVLRMVAVPDPDELRLNAGIFN